jgi:hypothetical protein
MNSLRVIGLGLAVVSGTVLLTGCTAGEIIAADGSPLTGYSGPSTVTFRNTSTFEEYKGRDAER